MSSDRQLVGAILDIMTTNIIHGEPIGSLKWVIYDTAAKGLLSRGERTLQTSDVKIKSVNKAMYDKKIDLGGHFSFGLGANTDRENIATAGGFALMGRREDERSFGWEWFQVDGFGHALKLQESGELSFDTKITPNGTEINRMEFLTDVSIRISHLSDTAPSRPAWRINIFQGSVIYWPVLVNGEVQGLL